MIMLIVALAALPFVPAMPAAAHQGQTTVSATTTNSDHGTCNHDGCPVEQQADMQGACFASGAGPSILAPVAAIAYTTTTQSILMPALDRALVDHRIPPALRPPKQI